MYAAVCVYEEICAAREGADSARSARTRGGGEKDYRTYSFNAQKKSMKRTRTIIIGALAVFGLAIGAIFVWPIFHKDFATVTINGSRLIVEVAADQESQIKGLAGRDGMAPNQAMLFPFARADRYGFWMKGMKFPLDIFWIKNNVVADIEESAPAPAPGPADAALPVYRPDVPADAVLETVAGFAHDHGVKIGDAVAISGAGGMAQANAAAASGAGATAAPEPSVVGEEYFIDYLRLHPPVGSDFTIGKVLARTDAYNKFAITYRVDGIVVTGVMNVPRGPIPAGGFPTLILNHGLIRPEIYFSGRGSKREQDFFARHGYVTIHPDYRGYSSITSLAADGFSAETETAAITWPWYGRDPAFPEHHDFYEGYSKDVLALIDALKKQKPAIIDVGRIGMWGHSMGGGIAARVMVRTHDVRAFVLFAPISADAEDNFYEFTADEAAWLHATYGNAGDAAYRAISPITYFGDVSAPVQLHHGLTDTDVPPAFSQKMFTALIQNNKKAELFTYPGEKHEFIKAWSLAAGRALQFFDKYVKNAR